MMKGETTAMEAGESSSVVKDKAPLMADESGRKIQLSTPMKPSDSAGGFKRIISVFDFLLRLAAVIAALAAASVMGTSDETLPFFTQFFQFQASYDDLPTFQFFVIAMAIVAGYLVLSLPFSIVTIIRPQAAAPRLLLLISDTAALTLTTAATSASAAIVFLAHSGNANTNWLAICQQFGDFCQKTSGAVVSSFVAVVFLMILIVISAIALKSH